MTRETEAINILLDELKKSKLDLDPELVRRIYTIEESVQFDGNRTEAPAKIRQVITASIEKDDLED